MTLSAQTVQTAQEADWRRANDAVGALKRGHADVLKWEDAHLPPTVDEVSSARMAMPTPDVAVRMAWSVHRKLNRPLARLGLQNTQRILEGRWTELDPSLQRRVEDADEVFEVAISARKAWIEAVAAQQTLRHQREMLEAAEAAYALGQRMVTVGNWSALQLAPVRLAALNARMNGLRAQQAAAKAQATLVKMTGLMGIEDGFVLPDQLPSIPLQPMDSAELQQRADAIRGQLPHAQGLHNRALSKTAMDVYRAAHALALDSQEGILKTREFIAEETVLHYNGMLKSVWDLLNETRNRSQAAVEATGSQRDFWLAEADLQWVLQGGEPSGFVSLSGGGGEAPAGAPH